MKRRYLIVALALTVAVMASGIAFAEDQKMDKGKACAVLGNCGDEMVQQARAMLEQCNKMMAKAEELMDKGKAIRGQGQLWGDKQMEADGMSVYEQGRKMYDEAKALSDTCSVIITEGEKMKNKYVKTGTPPKETPTPVRKGDQN